MLFITNCLFALLLVFFIGSSKGSVQNESRYLSEVYSETDSFVELPPLVSYENPQIIREPRLGEVRGKILNKNIRAFYGLQYGRIKPGLGRFQKADFIDHSSIGGIVDATIEPKDCPQFPNLQEVHQNESRGIEISNCLYLNVFAPNKNGTFPVMVHVHGEMLFDGSAAEVQPDYLLRENLVLVSVSYRLAPFGFLTTLSDELPGNVALADLEMALQWVRQHIHNFGGAVNDIALSGQAGGATLVHAFSLSDKSQGLFQKVILQSGTALNPYFLDEDPLSTARSLARLARCPFTAYSLDSLTSCFERISTYDLLVAFKRHWQENEPRGLRFSGGFKLVVGDKLGYLKKHPAALVSEFNYPLLAGVAKDAGAFIMSRFYRQLQHVNSGNITDYINVVLRHTTHPRFYNVWRQWALQHIFSEVEGTMPLLPVLAQGLLELTNLILYRAPLIDSIRYSWQRYQTFLYCFDYRGEFHRFGHLNNPLPFAVDATLSDDSIYLFPYPPEVAQLNADDQTVVWLLTRIWATFTAYSTPDWDRTWPRVNSHYGPFMRITNTTKNHLEVDYHFGEGIPIPNLYPEYFSNSTTTITTTETTTRSRLRNHNQTKGIEGDLIVTYIENFDERQRHLQNRYL